MDRRAISFIRYTPASNQQSRPFVRPLNIGVLNLSSDVWSCFTYKDHFVTFDGQCRSDTVAEQAHKPKSKPASEPMFEPTSERASEPIFEPTSEQPTDPTLVQISEPATEPIFEPTSEPATEPIFEPTSERASEPVFEPTSEQATDSTLVQTSEPASEPIFEPTSKSTIEPVFQPQMTVLLQGEQPAVELVREQQGGWGFMNFVKCVEATMGIGLAVAIGFVITGGQFGESFYHSYSPHISIL